MEVVMYYVLLGAFVALLMLQDPFIHKSSVFPFLNKPIWFFAVWPLELVIYVIEKFKNRGGGLYYG